MNSTRAAARRAGALNLLFSMVAICGEFFFPAFVVTGDATSTARNITAGEPAYRIAILTGLVTNVLFLFVVLSLYDLLKDADRKHARLMVILVSVGVALSLANMINKFAPLILLSGADYLSVFAKPQLDSLALGFFRLHSNGVTVATAFWGLWLFPFGILVIKSGFFPRVLGVLLMVAGSANLTTSVTTIALPDYRHVVSQVMMPLYFGELPIVFWLLIKGAKAPQPQAQSSDVN